MKCLPKFAGARTKDLRPLALQNACLKWMSTVVLLQTVDALQQSIPPEQKGFLPGHQMVDHIVYARSEWARLPEQVMVAVYFQKGYDSVTFTLMKTTLLYLGLAEAYVKLLLSIMAGPILFCVGRTYASMEVLRPAAPKPFFGIMMLRPVHLCRPGVAPQPASPPQRGLTRALGCLGFGARILFHPSSRLPPHNPPTCHCTCASGTWTSFSTSPVFGSAPWASPSGSASVPASAPVPASAAEGPAT